MKIFGSLRFKTLTTGDKEKIAFQNMERFRGEPLYRFWLNVYHSLKKRKEKEMGAVWLNGRKPPFMESCVQHDLDTEKMVSAAKCLTYDALHSAAALFFCTMNALGFSPAEMSEMLEEKKAGVSTAIETPDLDNHEGEPA